MARLGEGDKDGSWKIDLMAPTCWWHWAETDCLEWSRSFLTNLLSNKTLIDGQGNLKIRTKKIEKLEGEAYVNIRKGKIIPGLQTVWDASPIKNNSLGYHGPESLFN
ncbi:hypothetical protein HAX54_031930 [Datura stramonium]|uniref:Activator of Hsp90 ATPase AHSA1-like N-terminal domain-containing protein n=1 Tax=Datura stramonium TaxID=4076 RepID=A0ABS8SCA6_DATST|nr:hypothetical protein [Datura stramonium]